MKHFPDFATFRALARGVHLVPVYRRLLGDALTPVSAFHKIDTGPTACLFESVIGGEKVGRYSFLAAQPFLQLEARGNQITISDDAGRREFACDDPLEELKTRVEAVRSAVGRAHKGSLALRRPDLKLVEFRGNVQTRMRKLEEGVAEATFLAMAGLTRLGMLSVARGPIAPEEMLPAVAQGAIGVERRSDDARVGAMLAAVHDRETGLRLAAERAFLLRLDGSCQTPIAGLAVIEGDQVWLRGEILRPDGSESVAGERRGPVGEGAEIGLALAEELLGRAGPGFFD